MELQQETGVVLITSEEDTLVYSEHDSRFPNVGRLYGCKFSNATLEAHGEVTQEKLVKW